MYSIDMSQMELFSDNDNIEPQAMDPGISDISILFELSIEAFYAALYADMSELPIKAEIKRYIEKVKKAGKSHGNNNEARKAADIAASDRGDPDVLTVLKSAAKVTTEIHRLMGFLRFSPAGGGRYIARCSPDHFILPALAEHFSLRFGESPWAIIDEKRGLCLYQNGGPGEQARLVPVSEAPLPAGMGDNDPEAKAPWDKDPWEELWRLYHRSVNNEARKNPRLQRQFMPERYQKYLTELH